MSRSAGSETRGSEASRKFSEACRIGDAIAVKKQLVDRKGAGLDINYVDENGNTALMHASALNQIEVATLLLQCNEIQPGMIDSWGRQAIHWAARYGFPDIIKLLLEKRVGVNTKIAPVGGAKCSGQTPLIVTSFCYGDNPSLLSDSEPHDFTGSVRVLLSNGADVNLADDQGLTPFYVACEHCSDIEIPELLISHGADVNKQIDEGLTCLSRACFCGHCEVVDLLLKNGANADLANNRGFTPLMAASQEGKLECMILLLSHYCTNWRSPNNSSRQLKSAVNAQANQGQTALLLACGKNELQAGKVLLESGADLSLADNNHFTPLYMAALYNSSACVELLLKWGAEVVWDGEYSPLTVDRERGHKDVVRILEDHRKGSRWFPTLSPGNDLGLQDVIDKMATLSMRGVHLQEIARAFLKDLKLADGYFDPGHDICFCEKCHRDRGDNLTYRRGNPPKNYGLPIGWCKFSLSLKPQAHTEKIFEKWHVAFHGTKVENIGKILRYGDLLLPGDVTPAGEKLRIPDNHFKPDHENPNMRPPPGHNVNKFYFSPSIRYAGHGCYAPIHGWKHPETGQIYHIRVGFQVRIEPGTYDISKETVGALKDLDPLFPNSELEWSTERRGVSMLVGLLVKVEGLQKEKTVETLKMMARKEPHIPQDFRI